jgi:hypothetical protein
MELTIKTVMVDGEEKEVVSGLANTGHPQYNTYTPSHLAPGTNKEVSARTTTTLFFRVGEETVRIRANFWGEAAEDAKLALVDSNRVATLQVHNARISHYVDQFGEKRRSININFPSQYKVLRVEEHGIDRGFMSALERSKLDRAFMNRTHPGTHEDSPF